MNYCDCCKAHGTLGGECKKWKKEEPTCFEPKDSDDICDRCIKENCEVCIVANNAALTNRFQEKKVNRHPREEKLKQNNSKYKKNITCIETHKKYFCDVYSITKAYDISYQRGHAIKKLLCAGNRGNKDILLDLKEAIQTIESEIKELEGSRDG